MIRHALPPIAQLHGVIPLRAGIATGFRRRGAAVPPQPPVTAKNTRVSLMHLVKQYGSDALIFSGAITSLVLLVTPEPFFTKIIGGVLAFLCIMGGAAAKHHFLAEARLAPELEEVVTKLGDRSTQLGSETTSLEATRAGLVQTHKDLQGVNKDLDGNVTRLAAHVHQLREEATMGLASLNTDRNSGAAVLTKKNDRLNKAMESVRRMQDELRQRQEDVRVQEEHSRTLAAELEQRRLSVLQAEQVARDARSGLLREAFKCGLVGQKDIGESTTEENPP